MSRVFVDTGVLIRYFAEDDPPRALAAARLIDSDATLVLSTGVLIELVHALRTQHGMVSPAIGNALIRFLSRSNIELSDASRGQVIAALMWSLSTSARRFRTPISPRPPKRRVSTISPPSTSGCRRPESPFASSEPTVVPGDASAHPACIRAGHTRSPKPSRRDP